MPPDGQGGFESNAVHMGVIAAATNGPCAVGAAISSFRRLHVRATSCRQSQSCRQPRAPIAGAFIALPALANTCARTGAWRQLQQLNPSPIDMHNASITMCFNAVSMMKV